MMCAVNKELSRLLLMENVVMVGKYKYNWIIVRVAAIVLYDSVSEHILTFLRPRICKIPHEDRTFGWFVTFDVLS